MPGLRTGCLRVRYTQRVSTLRYTNATTWKNSRAQFKFPAPLSFLLTEPEMVSLGGHREHSIRGQFHHLCLYGLTD